jgi:hypothetical protein
MIVSGCAKNSEDRSRAGDTMDPMWNRAAESTELSTKEDQCKHQNGLNGREVPRNGMQGHREHEVKWTFTGLQPITDEHLGTGQQRVSPKAVAQGG